MKKLISIITVTYNAEKNIEKTIRSVIQQEENFYEYIIIDGNSTDKTVDIIGKYKEHISYFISEKDNGIYDAMNKGICVSTGQYCFFLQAGDSLHDDALKKISPFLNGENLFVYGNVYRINEHCVYDGEFDVKKILDHNICQQAIFYHRDIFSQLGLFDIRYNIKSDYVHNLKCFANSKIKKKYVDYIISNYDAGISLTTNDQIYDRNHHYITVFKLFGLKWLGYVIIFISCKRLFERIMSRCLISYLK